jgi:hypothetical protein
MDDKTLMICAATLCVVGIPFTQLLGSGGPVRAEHWANANAGSDLSAIRLSELGAHAEAANGKLTLLSARR